jgi:Zn-dependent protease with chaperone function
VSCPAHFLSSSLPLSLETLRPERDLLTLVTARRVKRVVSRLLAAAEQLLAERVADFKANGANATLNDPILGGDKSAEDWQVALDRLRSGEWEVVVVNNSSPNAYVTPLVNPKHKPLNLNATTCILTTYNLKVPRVVFVHRGLLAKNVAPSDAALAFVLGHEISHTLLKHGEHKLWLDVSLLMGTMAIIGSLDPTGMPSTIAPGALNPTPYTLHPTP